MRLVILANIHDAFADHGDLYHDGAEEEGEADGALAVSPEERHEEAESDPDHHVDILIH